MFKIGQNTHSLESWGAGRVLLVAVMKCTMTMKIVRQCLVQFVTVINTLMDGLCPLCPAAAGHRLAGVIWRNVRDKDEPQIQLFVLIKVE